MQRIWTELHGKLAVNDWVQLVCLQLGSLNRQYIAQEIGESGILVLSLLGGTAQISISELSAMHITDFAKIYSVCLHALYR